MAISFLTAQRSKDPNTQVGACIVNPQTQHIVGTGYNGFPAGCSDDDLPWRGRDPENTNTNDNNLKKRTHPLHQKYMYVCHAEVNAILNAKNNPAVRGATLYVALFPCNECAKMIIQAGIRTVVYLSDRYHDTDACRASRILLHMAGIQVRHYVPRIPSLTLSLQ